MVKILIKNILYNQSQRNYVKIVTTEKEIVTHKSISEFEEKLSALFFLRLHRSFIVAINKIKEYSAIHVQIGDHKISIGRNYKLKVLDFLEKYANTDN